MYSGRSAGGGGGYPGFSFNLFDREEYSDWPPAGTTIGLYQGPLGWLRVVYPFSRVMNERIKEFVGKGAYRYEPSTHQWYIIETMAQRFYDFCADHGYDVETDLPVAGDETGLTAADNPWIELFSVLDAEKRRTFYRTAVRLFHPDVGGDTRLMALLNKAYKATKED